MHRVRTVTVVATSVAALALAACSSSSTKASSAPSSSAPAATTSAPSSSAPAASAAASSPTTVASSPAAASSAPASSAAASSPGAASSAGALTGTAVVFAASSLKGVFTTLIANFEAANPGVKLVPSYGGSDTLAAQITQGAPVDVFAAASAATMATVTKASDSVGTPVLFAKNELEIAVPPSNPKDIIDLADTTKSGVKLALCAAAVPCGAAATKAYAAAKLTPHPVTLEQDVASVLTKVELGEVDAGVVYQTDVKGAGSKVKGVNFAEAASAINSYPIVAVKTGKNLAVGRAFAAYVSSATGQAVLQAAGFQQP
jgi:molybdate transport system substrate-binding protein